MVKKTSPDEKFDDYPSVAEYADMKAEVMWEEQHMDKNGGESPEECAKADMAYWG